MLREGKHNADKLRTACTHTETRGDQIGGWFPSFAKTYPFGAKKDRFRPRPLLVRGWFSLSGQTIRDRRKKLRDMAAPESKTKYTLDVVCRYVSLAASSLDWVALSTRTIQQSTCGVPRRLNAREPTRGRFIFYGENCDSAGNGRRDRAARDSRFPRGDIL